MFKIRPAKTAYHNEIVQLSHVGWHDAHADLVPLEVLPFRTKEHFTVWQKEAQDAFFTAPDDAGARGFDSVKGAEIFKLYVSNRAPKT